jgi:4-amino-4-deoxy-L-arabinose transferase-like glycosyltransferase
MLDVPNAALNSLSLYFLLISLENPINLLPAAFILSIGFLNRQFLAFIGLFVFIIYLILEKNLKPYRFRDLLLPTLLFFVITLPWHVVETIKYGRDFWEVYILHQTFSRFSQTIEGKYAPLFWYVTVARTHFRIWFVALLPSIAYFVHRVAKRNGKEALIFIWALITFTAFTLAKSKLIWYIMPLYPPLSIMVAVFIYNVAQRFKVSFIAPAAVLIVAATYNYSIWNKIQPRDFTGDQAKLIEYKNRVDPNMDLLSVGYSYSVSSFYSLSKVAPVPKEEMRGFFDALGYKYAIITLGDLNSLTNKGDYRIIYSVGDGALISKP